MKKVKKLLAIVLTTAICLAALTGCSKSPVESEPNPNGGGTAETMQSTEEKVVTGETVTINFWHHYSAQSAENETLTKIIIPQFESENPDIKVNAVSHEWADLHDKILISAKSSTLPDVARLDSAWIPEFEKMGILVALNKEMSDSDKVAENLLESAMSTTSIKGNNYGLTLNTKTKIVFYNVEALQEAGVKIPTTMDEFVNAVSKLSGNNSNGQQVWGYNEPALSGWNLCPFI